MTNNITKKLYDYLLKLNLIDKNNLDSVFNTSQNNSHTFINLLLQKELISDKNLGIILADLFDTPLIDLSKIKVEDRTLNIIPEIVAKKQLAVSFAQDKDAVSIAMNNPLDKEFVKYIQKKVDKPVKVYFATHSSITDFLINYQKDIEKTFDDLLSGYVETAKKSEKKEVSISNIVDTLINYAYQNKASDIHIEPFDENTLIRFRIDGVLHDVINLPISFHDNIIFRIKVLSRLKTDEHLSAQDGKMQLRLDSEDLDIRVSIVPIVEGEKAVLRLLSSYARQFSLKELGMSNIDLEKVNNTLKVNTGMILATGPTGCGKTTTIYSILKKLNTREVNISTIEDPVEYDIEGVNQIQVNTKTNLTFSHGLKSILRQDPNIIFVGEIRDEETAEIAINSALTGHLVLSTLHTNDSVTTLPRLIDMNIEPFLVSSTVNLIIAQRLIRKICTNCKTTYSVHKDELKNIYSSSSLKKIFKTKDTVSLYKGKGCSVCHDSGYFSRIGVFEVLEVTDEIKHLIMQKSDSENIKKLALKQGLTTMFDDGIEKALNGLTTLDEVIKNIKDD